MHTLAWAIFVGVILGILVAAVSGQFKLAGGLSLLVWGEVLILAVNGMRCPLTGIAARYTENRAANFDIFLPLWLARWNKHIFGALFAASQAVLWFMWRSNLFSAA
ncbi:MAG: hypothetical protein ACOYLS_15470 [Polymorphobacter sp.]